MSFMASVEKKDLREFLAALGANFLASLGSSAVLNKGVALQGSFPGAFGDSLSAFLVGSAIAFLLLSAPNRTERTAAWLCPVAFSALVVMGALGWYAKTSSGAG